MIHPSTPLVSVIMPSYNHERYLAEAIDSVLSQTVVDLELIIIDDASLDRSRQIIERRAAADRRVRPAFHETNRGIARTMNDGLAVARGRFVAPIASDDIWEPHKLERQLEILSRDESLIVWSDGRVIDADGRLTGLLFTQMVRAGRRKKSGEIFDELLIGNFILGSSRIMKRPEGDLRWRDERLRYLNDYQYAVDLASRFAYHFIEEPLVRYRVHPENTVARDLSGYYEDSIRLRRYLRSRYRHRMGWVARLYLYRYSLVLLTKLLSRRLSRGWETARRQRGEPR